MTHRIIKRYENRKLYDTIASGYISLADIAALVRSGETVKVVDNATGDDLTAATLMQVMLDEGKKGKSLLPTELLHDVLRRSSDVLESGMSSLRSSVDGIKESVDDFVHHSVEKLSALLPQQKENQELQELRTQLQHLEGMLGKLLDEKEKIGD